jgi:tRNA pseudouridine13 synthase
MTAILDCPILPLHPLPRVTADLPGCGGQLRVNVEDFEVEELPLYEPCGQGDHLYLWLQKIDTPAESLRRHVARSLGVATMDVGMAGLKDRRAITRQWVSVPRSAEARAGQIDTDRIRVLNAVPHRNKLRTAHLAGNRFRIRVRGTLDDALQVVAAKLERLQLTGVPDFFGSQRMGIGGSTLAAGWALLHGADRLVRVRTPDDTVHTLHLEDRPLRRLAASAVQAEVFNRTLALRLERGVWTQVLAGDVCRKVLSGGTFVTDDPDREQKRALEGELAVTGPMWGPKMIRAQGQAGDLEREVLAMVGLTEADFATLGHLAEGTRRPVVVRPGELQVEPEDDGVTVTFTLPAGAFATVLLHELMGPVAGEDAPLDDAAESGRHGAEGTACA